MNTTIKNNYLIDGTLEDYIKKFTYEFTNYTKSLTYTKNKRSVQSVCLNTPSLEDKFDNMSNMFKYVSDMYKDYDLTKVNIYGGTVINSGLLTTLVLHAYDFNYILKKMKNTPTDNKDIVLMLEKNLDLTKEIGDIGDIFTGLKIPKPEVVLLVTDDMFSFGLLESYKVLNTPIISIGNYTTDTPTEQLFNTIKELEYYMDNILNIDYINNTITFKNNTTYGLEEGVLTLGNPFKLLYDSVFKPIEEVIKTDKLHIRVFHPKFINKDKYE